MGEREGRREGENRRTGSGRDGRRTIALALLALAAYHALVRPRHRRWGTTNGEADRPLPGDDVLPGATKQVTHAIGIDAPPEAVWPWLVQIGQGRGGFYSYDRLERLVGAEIHNVDRIDPALQDLEVGDVVRLAPADYPVQSPESAPEVVRLDPGRAFVLRPPGDAPPWTWAFVLEPTAAGTTRLVVRMRSNPSASSLGLLGGHALVARLIDYAFWDPAHFVMERGMLKGIKRRAEAGR